MVPVRCLSALVASLCLALAGRAESPATVELAGSKDARTPVGCPVVLTLRVANAAAEEVQVNPLLLASQAPQRRTVRIEIKSAQDQAYHAITPSPYLGPAKEVALPPLRQVLLKPKQALEQQVVLTMDWQYQADSGYRLLFPTPGTYTVRATFRPYAKEGEPDELRTVTSDPVEVVVTAPEGKDAQAWDALRKIPQWWVIHAPYASVSYFRLDPKLLEAFLDQHATSVYADPVRLTLAKLVVQRGTKPDGATIPSNLPQARSLLTDLRSRKDFVYASAVAANWKLLELLESEATPATKPAAEVLAKVPDALAAKVQSLVGDFYAALEAERVDDAVALLDPKTTADGRTLDRFRKDLVEDVAKLTKLRAAGSTAGLQAKVTQVGANPKGIIFAQVTLSMLKDGRPNPAPTQLWSFRQDGDALHVVTIDRSIATSLPSSQTHPHTQP